MFTGRAVRVALLSASLAVAGGLGAGTAARAHHHHGEKMQAPTDPVAPVGDVSGTYRWTAQGRGGQEMKVALKLKQEGQKVTGTITGFGGQESEIRDGKIAKDGKITFKTIRKWNDQERVTMYSAKVEGEAIKGKSEFERNGQKMSRDFEGKKAKPGEEDKEGEKRD